MNVYCKKDRRVTPNVKGTEKSQVCCVRYYKNSLFAGKLCERSGEEGAEILSSVADTATELFISKGITYLAKRGVEAGRYHASEAMRNPALQRKEIKYGMKKARPRLKKLGASYLTSFQQLESSLPPKEVVFCPETIAHVRYINILTWLRGFRVKIVYFFKFLLSLNSQKRLGYKENNTKYGGLS